MNHLRSARTILVGLFVLLCVGMVEPSLLIGSDRSVTAGNDESRSDIVWTTPSNNAADSMPCGGGDIGLNVWCEGKDLLIYIARSGTFDENNAMLKLGRVRISNLIDSLAVDSRSIPFEQRLCLQKGSVAVRWGDSEVDIWVDQFRPAFHIECQSAKPRELTVAYESWRTEDRLLSSGENGGNSYKPYSPNFWVWSKDKQVTTYQDSISHEADGILFVHRNRSDRESIFDLSVAAQSLSAVKSQLDDPLLNRTFGGLLSGSNFEPSSGTEGRYGKTPFKGWCLQSKAAATRQDIRCTLHVAQSESLEKWKHEVLAMDQEAQLATDAYDQTLAWWREFWERSFFELDGSHEAVEISRNYRLFRYMLACNARGPWPTKFNGGLFTFDPCFVDPEMNYSPDYRKWGGGIFTAQNQRLVYYPMLRSGDFDLMEPIFAFYRMNQNNAEVRSRHYWGHAGACFTEQLESFGLPNVAEYVGTGRSETMDPGIQNNRYVAYLWDTALEICFQTLERHKYSGASLAKDLPLIESCLTFWEEHYRERDLGKQQVGQETIRFYPTSAAESYKMTLNSTTTVTALYVLLEQLLSLPDDLVTDAQRTRWQRFQKLLPEIPLRTIRGKQVLAPAESWEWIQGLSEKPQLYPVYPWSQWGVGRPGLEVARNTFELDPYVVENRSHLSWTQINIFAARLGLTDVAKDYTVAKLRNGPHRFPAFWGPGYDWTPDHNWGGTGMIGLQEMAMQCVDRKIYLFPAWPQDWNGRFRMHAPYKTVVEASISNGTLTSLRVEPDERMQDIVSLVPTSSEIKVQFVSEDELLQLIEP